MGSFQRQINYRLNISATETCAIDLEYSSKKTDAECLCQKVSHNFNKNLYMKALVQMKNNKDKTTYSFEKGSVFVVLSGKKCHAKYWRTTR